MRLLLLIMTGIGFTLGLLCGLLLQLPADGLPASHNLNLPVSNDGIIRTGLDIRSRRSFNEESRNGESFNGESLDQGVFGALIQTSPVETPSGGQAEVFVDNAERKPAYSLSPSSADLVRGSAAKPAFQSAPNPLIAPQPFVSGDQGGLDKGRPQAAAHTATGQLLAQPEHPAPSEAESPNSEKKQRVYDREGPAAPLRSDSGSSKGVAAGGSGNQRGEPPQPLPLSQGTETQTGGGEGGGGAARLEPITSFTLRLKKTGLTVVIDSANPVPKTNSAADVQNSGTPAKVTLPLDRVVSGVVWSHELEETCPKGFEPREVAAWRRMARGLQVVGVEEGCGRMQNRLVTFRDASKACARYRLNTDQIQGEIYSYYLARLLNITNLPPAVILPVDTLSEQWRTVHLDMSLAQWADGRIVVLTKWLDHLKPSHIPQELREDDRKLHPTRGTLGGRTVEELCDLMQWSDLIVFDYLTANLDRLVNNMFNKQWNADMMNNPAHNLERTKDGSLVFLDNESGLFHGYRLLDKYQDYHESLLNSLCVFRDRTATAVKVLHNAGGVGDELKKLLTEGEEHHRHLPAIPDKNVSVLKERLSRVYDQIVKCEALYGQR